MKSFKSTAIILTLCIIGNINTKQVGKKGITTSPVTTPSSAPSSAQGSRGHGKASSYAKATEDRSANRPQPQKQLQLQKGTFREFLNEIRNMKTNDIFTPDRSQFTDKVVWLIASARISPLERLETDSLLHALTLLHVIGTIIPIEDVLDPNKEKEHEKKIKSLTNDLNKRVEALVEKQNPTIQEFPKEKPKTEVTKKEEKKELPKFEQPRVTEKNKQMMQGRLEIETALKLNMFIDKSDLDNNDMKKICTEIDFLLRKANLDYEQLGSTNAEKIANANMAIDMVKKEIINKLSELKPKTMLKLADYILLTKQNDKTMIEIGKELNMRATAQSL